MVNLNEIEKQSKGDEALDAERRSHSKLREQVLRWVLTDFIWATLPLSVLLLVALLNPSQPASGFENRPFFTNVEWSFASIVLFATCLRELLRVRMDVQRGSTALTAGIIAGFSAILVLNTTVLGIIYSERLGARMNLEMVAILQGIFFFGAIAATLFVFLFESRVRTELQARQAREDLRDKKLEEILENVSQMRS